MQRRSKKRDAILECLRSTTSHPTAEWIYARLKPQDADLSLATVYRNLSQLKDAGMIRSVGFVAGEEHFDGTTEPHSHAVCLSCGKIVDLTDRFRQTEDLTGAVERETEFVISDTVLQFRGLCRECQKKENQTESTGN